MQKIKSVLSSGSDNSTAADSHGVGHSTTGNSAGQLPVREGVAGRAEEAGAGSHQTVTGATPGFAGKHSIGHDRSHPNTNEFDLKSATHDHTHLGHKTHEHHHVHQTEEVTRQKEHERHVHHVQHHVQPVHDVQHDAVQHSEKIHPVTKISEKHGSTKEDIAAFQGLAKHKDEVHEHGTERKVVDLGEQVSETTHHHVHNVVQPVLHQEKHHHEVIHTTIPSHHVTHEAPVVHESISHPVVSKADFLKQGGALGSNVSHHEANILQEGGCDRQVEGVGEKLARELHLKSGTVADQHKADTRI